MTRVGHSTTRAAAAAGGGRYLESNRPFVAFPGLDRDIELDE